MNSRVQTSPSVLSVDDQRQVIYAALLRFNLEAMELRQRAMKRVVLNGLLGSTEQQPYKFDKIQKNLRKTPHAPELREDSLKETLSELSDEGKVKRIEQKSSKAYCLTAKGEAEVHAVLGEAVNIFDAVIQHMLEHTQSIVPFDTAAAVCRAFIIECFSKFGRQIARSIMGRLDQQELAKTVEIKLAFEAAIQGRKLSDEVHQSLSQRCVQFIRSKELQDEKLKFQLTQGFFLAELLGIETTSFDPLSRQTFNGAVFYLDTNVLFLGLLSHQNKQTSFDELLRIAAKFGITLRTTRATIDEARRVLANRRSELEKYLANCPGDLNAVTHDSFLSAYQYLGANDPELTPTRFFEQFDRLADIIEQDWRVSIHDVTEDEILGQTTLGPEATIIQGETKSSRGLIKSDLVLRHDVAMLALVRKERLKNRNTWLLTLDRSLIRAASQLTVKPAAPKVRAATANGTSVQPGQANRVEAAALDELPFCFSLDGFLQSISPFTASPEEERSVVNIFSGVVAEYLSSETLFDMREMNLLMELHEDVMMTPAEKLIPALDFIKTDVLHGRQYTGDKELRKVSLELKKYLAKSTDERQRALEEEKQRQADKALQAETELQRERADREAEARANAEEKEKAQRAATSRQWRDRMIAGLILGAVFWFFQDGLVASALSKGLDPVVWEPVVRAVVVTLAAVSILVPTIFFLKDVPWRGETVAVVISLLVLAGLASTRLLNDNALSRWSSLIQIAVLVGQIIFLLVTRNRKASSS